MDKVTMSKVTIAIPTRNRANYLLMALTSAQLQTYPNIEIIISNNCSNDNTMQLLSEISDDRVTVIDQKTSLSMAENWNACVKAASGKYFLLLSDDDCLEPNAIEELIAPYESSPVSNQIGMVYSLGRFIDEKGNTVGRGMSSPVIEGVEPLILGCANGERTVFLCSILFRMEDLQDGFMPQYELGTDAAQWIQSVVKHGLAYFVNKPLVGYRVHQNTTSKTPMATRFAENVALIELAITELDKRGRCSPELARKLRQSIKQHNLGLMPYLILQSVDGNKGRALAACLQQKSAFANLHGVKVIVRFLVSSFCPEWFKQRYRDWKHRRAERIPS